MKTTIAILLFSCLLFGACGGQAVDKTNADTATTAAEMPKDGRLDYTLFDGEGKLLEVRNLDDDRKKIVQNLIHRAGIVRMAYDEAGRLVEMTYLNADSTKSKPIYKHQLTYSDEGRIAKRVLLDAEGQEIDFGEELYKYDNNGRLIEKHQPSESNSPNYYRFQYNDKGQLVRQDFYNAKEEQISINNIGIHHIEYQYEQGKLAKEIIHYSGYAKAGEKLTPPRYKGVSEFSYDEKGRLALRTTRPREEDLSKVDSFQFQYAKEEMLYGKYKLGTDAAGFKISLPYQSIQQIVDRQLFFNGNQLYDYPDFLE
ncbi:MAG: hypothetical protein AAFV95_26955 [Bacteroidota bacterium]